MKTAAELARFLLDCLARESEATAAIARVREVCQGELAAMSPGLVERRVGEATSLLVHFGLPASRLAAFTLLAFAQIETGRPWSEAQRKSMRLHDVLAWIDEQYGVRYAENTRESLRRDVIAPMVRAGALDHNPDSPGLPPNHPRNHYALNAAFLKQIRLH